jgi:hypothetical protein
VLDKVATAPPAGAAWFSVRIAVAGAPPVTLPGWTVRSIGEGAEGGDTVIAPDPPTPLTVPTRLTPIQFQPSGSPQQHIERHATLVA